MSQFRHHLSASDGDPCRQKQVSRPVVMPLLADIYTNIGSPSEAERLKAKILVAAKAQAQMGYPQLLAEINKQNP